jgi:hypothetical protein
MKIGRFQFVWYGLANIGKRTRTVGVWPSDACALFRYWACGPLELRAYQ